MVKNWEGGKNRMVKIQRRILLVTGPRGGRRISISRVSTKESRETVARARKRGFKVQRINRLKAERLLKNKTTRANIGNNAVVFGLKSKGRKK